mgnify:CR=1 FL=1
MNQIVKNEWLNIMPQLFILGLLLCLISVNSAYASNSLEKVDFSSMPGEKLQIKMFFFNY